MATVAFEGFTLLIISNVPLTMSEKIINLTTASCSSMLTFAILIFPSNSVASSSRIGAMALHGPHQGAQKSTSTGVGDAFKVLLKDSVVML